MDWSGPVVYVHGAGEQENPHLMKRRLDGLLFGRAQGDRTRLAYYADLLHGTPAAPIGLEARRVRDPVALATDPQTSRQELARALAGAPEGGLEALDDGRTALAETLLAQADAIEPPPQDLGGLEGRRFWDPGFRIVVGILARDVIHYLFDGAAEAMRRPLREALQGLTQPTLVIAHSLGTIVAFDVLSAPDYDGPQEISLVTLGSPLGIVNVQERLRDGIGTPNPIPGPVVTWSNFADPRDPVASGQALTGDYDPRDRIEDDITVDNPSTLHHDLVEYLRVATVRRAIGIA